MDVGAPIHRGHPATEKTLNRGGGVVALPSTEVGGAAGRAFSFMRAAASTRVVGGGGAVGGVAAGGAEGPACAGGGAEGPALSRKKYGETPVLAALLKMSPMPKPVTTSSSSSTFTASSAGAARVFRNHGSSGGMPLPVVTGVEEAGVGVGSEYEYSSVCGIEVNSLQKSHQKRGVEGAGDIGSMGTYAGITTGSATTSSTGSAGASTTGGAALLGPPPSKPRRGDGGRLYRRRSRGEAWRPQTGVQRRRGTALERRPRTAESKRRPKGPWP